MIACLKSIRLCPLPGPAAPQRAVDQLKFAPSSGMGESPGPVYKVHTYMAYVRACMRTMIEQTFFSCPPSPSAAPPPPSPTQVESAFNKSTDMKMRSSASTFGKSDRFHSPGSYLKKTENPGPGSYSAPSQRMRPQSASHGGRHSFRERSVDFGPAGEGADPAYTVQSSFDKAAARGSKPSSSFGTVRSSFVCSCMRV